MSLLTWLLHKAEEFYDPKPHLEISTEHLYDINSRADRNYWFDKRGNRWPLRDSL